MRALVALLIVTLLLIPSTVAHADHDDVFVISSFDDLMDIGVGTPSDGHYILDRDIVFPSVDVLEVTVERDTDSVSLTVTTDGYDPSDPVRELDVMLNGVRVVADGIPRVTFPSLVMMDDNILSAELDDMHGVIVIPMEELTDGSTIVMDAGSNTEGIVSGFTGTLDGFGHRISGIRMIGENVSLFGSCNGATFRDLTIDGTFVSFVDPSITDGDGDLSYQYRTIASSLVADAKDSTFERIDVMSDVISILCVDSTVAQGSADGLSFSTDCLRESIAGGLLATGEGCDIISCTSSGSVVSFIGSDTYLDASVTPTGVHTDSDSNRNVSITTSGGLTGTSDGNRFAFCSSMGRTMTSSNDRMSIYMDMAPGTSENRCLSESYNGSLSGRMVGSYVYGCLGSNDDVDMAEFDMSVSGTTSHIGNIGSITGSSVDCTMNTCRVAYSPASGYSEGDVVADVSHFARIPDTGFSVSIGGDVELPLHTTDGSLKMDVRNTILYCDIDIDVEIGCRNGSAILMGDRLSVNPDFDWENGCYKDMTIEVTEPDGPISADLVVLVVSCAIAMALLIFVVRSLRGL